MQDRGPAGRVRLTTIALPVPSLPTGFRGEVLRSEQAERAASLVSGPFLARPAAYVTPRDTADLVLLVRWAAEHGVPLIPRGGGTGMPGGNLGTGVVVAPPRDLRQVGPWIGAPRSSTVLRSGAAATAARIDEEARRKGRFLPCLPSSASWCTSGGLAANNAAGARTFRHGASAAWISALEGVDARGRRFRVGAPQEADAPALPGLEPPGPELAGRRLPLDDQGRPRGWPRVRKNSSGYALDRFLPERDLLQLLVGSEGTLAFLTAVEWSTAPVPASRGIALLPARTPEDVVRVALGAPELGATTCEFLGRRFIEMAGLALDPVAGPLTRDAYALLLLEVDGSAAEVQEKLAASAELGRRVAGEGIAGTSPEDIGRIWSLRHAASPMIAREAGRGRISTQFIEDSVVPVSSLAEYLEGLDRILEEARFDAVVFGHAGDGNVHVNPLVDIEAPDWKERVRWTLGQVVDLVAALGGTLSGEHGDGRLRAAYLERIWGSQLTEAFRAVKAHFDPSGIFNPGVILAGPEQDPLEHFSPRPRAHPPLETERRPGGVAPGG